MSAWLAASSLAPAAVATLQAAGLRTLRNAARVVYGAPSLRAASVVHRQDHGASRQYEMCCAKDLRGFASSTDSSPPRQSTYPPHFLLRMPQLSPLMEQGKLLRWKLSVGDEVQSFDLICDIEATTLTEREENSLTLEVESQEDGFVAKIMLEPGQVAAIGEPLLVLAQESGHISSFEGYDHTDAQRMQDTGVASTLYWQAYVKGSSLDM